MTTPILLLVLTFALGLGQAESYRVAAIIPELVPRTDLTAIAFGGIWVTWASAGRDARLQRSVVHGGDRSAPMGASAASDPAARRADAGSARGGTQPELRRMLDIESANPRRRRSTLLRLTGRLCKLERDEKMNAIKNNVQPKSRTDYPRRPLHTVPEIEEAALRAFQPRRNKAGELVERFKGGASYRSTLTKKMRERRAALEVAALEGARTKGRNHLTRREREALRKQAGDHFEPEGRRPVQPLRANKGDLVIGFIIGAVLVVFIGDALYSRCRIRLRTRAAQAGTKPIHDLISSSPVG